VNDNTSAFPAPMHAHQSERGMTLRDYFAAKAMAAQIQHAGCDNIGEEKLSGWAYVMADAMLKERSK